MIVSRRSALHAVLGAAATSACASDNDATLVRVQQGEMEKITRGAGSPAIVLVHGLGDDMGTWRKVIGPLAALTTVMAYNRFGYGKSGWTDAPRDAVTVSDELAALAAASGLGGRLVLVGHSLGGVYAQAFARRFPTRVAGMVLIDTAVPGQTAQAKAAMPAVFANVDKTLARQKPIVQREFLAAELADEQVNKLPPYRSGETVLLSALRKDLTTSAPYWAWRAARMRQLAADYAGEFVEVESGHFIQREQPDIVIDAVKRVLAG